MSDTVQVVVPSDDWVDVTNSATDGFITNDGNRRIKIFEDATKPAATSNIGHTLNPRDYIRYSLKDSQLVWAKAYGDQGSLVTITSE